MVFGELYRNGAEWKFRAVGQGYASGLRGHRPGLRRQRRLTRPALTRSVARDTSGRRPRRPIAWGRSVRADTVRLVVRGHRHRPRRRGVLGGPSALGLVAILAVLEVSLSFDNAVVNATVLERMSAFWQKIFLTVGILIAVFGMRLLFPLLDRRASPATAQPGRGGRPRPANGTRDRATHAQPAHEAHPAIAAFGGMFLLMLFLDFIFEEREHHLADAGSSGRWPRSASSTSCPSSSRWSS